MGEDRTEDVSRSCAIVLRAAAFGARAAGRARQLARASPLCDAKKNPNRRPVTACLSSAAPKKFLGKAAAAPKAPESAPGPAKAAEADEPNRNWEDKDDNDADAGGTIP